MFVIGPLGLIFTIYLIGRLLSFRLVRWLALAGIARGLYILLAGNAQARAFCDAHATTARQHRACASGHPSVGEALQGAWALAQAGGAALGDLTRDPCGADCR